MRILRQAEGLLAVLGVVLRIVEAVVLLHGGQEGLLVDAEGVGDLFQGVGLHDLALFHQSVDDGGRALNALGVHLVGALALDEARAADGMEALDIGGQLESQMSNQARWLDLRARAWMRKS